MRPSRFRKNKYNAQRTIYFEGELIALDDATEEQKRDGKLFHSWGEADRYVTLVAAKVKNLRCQVPFHIKVGDAIVCTYIADFVYETVTGQQEVEDVKGVRGELFALKKKLLEAVYGIYIREIKPRRKPAAKRKKEKPSG